jgi:AraC family transcriptional regulator of adaptative response/methylated-DNA-[protein]-cysteine methyltransferase
MDAADGKKDAEIQFAVGRCSLGAILVASSAKGVCAILFGSEPASLRHDLERQFPGARLIEGDARFGRVMAEVIAFVENPRRDLDLPLDIRGTVFQHRVWEALRRIPAGATASYAAVAASIGAPRAVRAVARACATNRIAVAIPCHRVVASDGSLSGYRGGVERKRALLAKEAQL